MMRAFLALFLLILLTSCSNKSAKIIPADKIKVSQVGATVGNPLFIRIFKAEKRLELWIKTASTYRLYKVYPIQKGSGLLGPKLLEGDRQNPEGYYIIDKPRLNPYSRYHLGLNIGFPNRLDRNLARTGSNIMIHGGAKSIGCFAMGDRGIEEIYSLVYYALKGGQPLIYVAIYPFEMTQEKLALYRDSPWFAFWKNLKEGYDIFEIQKIPPTVSVIHDRYIFKPSR